MAAPDAARIATLTALALCAFAANSLLCRLALGAGGIDAASFTAIRVVAGAALLGAILLFRHGGARGARFDWRTVAALFAYMVFFSFAYITLGAGTGALILFGAVQLTMLAMALISGERLSLAAWAGLALAICGLVYLVSPGLRSPDPLGASLMIVAGIAWGAYSLLGRGATDPVGSTALNFIWCAPLALLVGVFAPERHVEVEGVALAAASGAIASGCGYVIWYAALRGLTAGRAAVVQLAVPVIAALAAVPLLAEPITLRLVLASAATLGGVAIVLTRRSRKA